MPADRKTKITSKTKLGQPAATNYNYIYTEVLIYSEFF